MKNNGVCQQMGIKRQLTEPIDPMLIDESSRSLFFQITSGASNVSSVILDSNRPPTSNSKARKREFKDIDDGFYEQSDLSSQFTSSQPEAPQSTAEDTLPPGYKDNLRQVIATLTSANISYQENTKLYQAIFDNYFDATALAQACIALYRANTPYHGNEELYHAVIEKAIYADNVTQAFTTLTNANIFYQGNEVLYHAVIEKAPYANKLAQLFSALTKMNIPHQRNDKLYKALVDNAHFALNLEPVFTILVKANAFYRENTELYHAVAEKAFYADNLSQAFTKLVNANILYPDNAELYQAVIHDVYHATNLAQTFATMANASILYSDNAELYQAIIHNVHHVTNLGQAFTILANANILYQDNAELYQAIIHNVHHATNLAQVFTALANVNIFYPDNEELYQAIICNVSNILGVLNVLSALGRRGIKHSAYYNAKILLTNNELALFVLDRLTQAEYSFQTHHDVFHALLTLLGDMKTNHQKIINITNELCTYAKKNTLFKCHQEGFECQMRKLKDIVELEENLTLGPLNKSKSTFEIEKILTEISKTEIDNVLIIFKAPESYILKIPGQNEINLSLLIKNANFSQLTLSDELINILGDMLQKIVGNKFNISTDSNPIVKALPIGHQMAINIYVRNPCYININKLFRSEPLDSNGWKLHQQDNLNTLSCFLVGCLLNDAANRIKVIAWQKKYLLEKIANSYNLDVSGWINTPSDFETLLQKSQQAGLISEEDSKLLMTCSSENLSFYFPENTILDRGELLTPEIIRRRTANSWTFPALTSFSTLKQGSSYFHNDGSTRTKLAGAYGHYFVINSHDGEVIFPQGEQVIVTQGPGYLLAELKRSPTLEPKDHYWSDLALQDAFEYSLSKEYRDEKSLILLKNLQVIRPNHGLPHTYRVMTNINHVINYFAHYAKDEEFKLFCQDLNDSVLEWLRIAAAFSVTGRESEVSACSNPHLYDSYKAASAQNFMRFISKTSLKSHDTMTESIYHIVRHLGNPHYEKNADQSGIDETARKKCIFYHRILDVAHKIDLARCYTKKEYKIRIQYCRELSSESTQQENALNEMIRYNIHLIKVHGDRLHCDMDPNGEFIDVSLPYSEVFAETSTSLKRLIEITQTVPRPRIKQSFEFMIK